jgi:WhiB family redox-sensing transcriptional regulator
VISLKHRHVGFSHLTTGHYAIGWFNVFEDHWRTEQAIDLREWHWVTRAACTDPHEFDPEEFFDSEKGLDRERLTAICAACPVQTQCLDHALANDEWGWWGGTSRQERRQLLRET